MDIEKFIKNNPFPKNGTEVNNTLVSLIQDPKFKKEQKKNIYKLFKNNARVIYLVWKQFSYNQSLAAVASFVYEGIETTSKVYKIGSKKPYYSYAITYIRGLLQKYYNYNESLVHVPVKKKKDVKVDFSEIDNSIESDYLLYNDGEKNMEDDLEALFIEYGAQKLTPEQREELKITKLSRNMTIKDIYEKTGYKPGKIRNMIKRTAKKLRDFNFTHF